GVATPSARPETWPFLSNILNRDVPAEAGMRDLCGRVKTPAHPRCGNVPKVERTVPAIKFVYSHWEARMGANARSLAPQARSLSDRDSVAASTAGASGAKRLPAKSAASTERALLWAFIAGLAWCPFWFGSAVLLAWGINAVLFPGLV